MNKFFLLLVLIFLSASASAMYHVPYQESEEVLAPYKLGLRPLLDKLPTTRQPLGKRSPNTSIDPNTSVEMVPGSEVKAIAESASKTPANQGSASKIFITPNQKRFETIHVVLDPRAPQNIICHEPVRRYLEQVVVYDNVEELHNKSWHEKHVMVTNLFNLHERVHSQLASVMREHISLERSQQKSFDTPEKSLINHALTIEHMINMVRYGIAYLCLPEAENNVRLNIIAKLGSIDYSDAVRHQEHLDDAGWGTLSFIQNRDYSWSCIHYFHPEHPAAVTFQTDAGDRAHTYFIEPLSVVLGIDQRTKKLMFIYNPTDYRNAVQKLHQRRAEARKERRQLDQYVVQPGGVRPLVVSLADFMVKTPDRNRKRK